VHRFLPHTNTEGEIVVSGKNTAKNFIIVIHDREPTEESFNSLSPAAMQRAHSRERKKATKQRKMKEKYF
jgi:predicted transposase YbfD/YdcC